MPDNCDLCEKLSAGAFGLTNTYEDIFTWLVRWNQIFMDGSILKSEQWNNLKLLIFQESRLRVHQAKLGSGGVQEDLAEEGEVLKLIWQRKEGREEKWNERLETLVMQIAKAAWDSQLGKGERRETWHKEILDGQ